MDAAIKGVSAVSTKEKKSHSEFEREPVPASNTRGLKVFVGMYAGEHCAGTELMIGPLFVAAGVCAFNVVFGLLLGNPLAVELVYAGAVSTDKTCPFIQFMSTNSVAFYRVRVGS